MRSVAFLLAFLSSAFAYQVLSPGGPQAWTNVGPNLLTWSRVDTDRLNFTVLLVNQNITGYSPQNLAALVDGTLGKAQMNPPSGGWPTGSHFRINLVQDNQNLDTILAQSSEFNIQDPTKSSTSSSTSPSTTPPAVAPSTDSAAGSTPTDPLTIPTSSAALSDFTVQTSFLAFVSLMALALA